MAERHAECGLGKDIHTRLDDLRERGADHRAPVRFAYLAALARRTASQPEAVRQRLAKKIAGEADALIGREASPSAGKAEHASPAAANPLAELLAYIGEHTVALPTPGLVSDSIDASLLAKPEATPSSPELKSVAYFRDDWSKLLSEQQLTQTLARAPENAGPMNSQHLVLRALQTMREHSPEYLQAFMSYVDTLIWLEHASSAKPATSRTATVESEGKTGPAKRAARKRGANASSQKTPSGS